MPHNLIRWFDYGHLPPDLVGVSARFRLLAVDIDDELPDGAEKTTALRKLLEAKDAAVRAAIEARP